MVYKQELSMNLATDEFRLEPGVPESRAERCFAPAGDIYQSLSDADCREFIDGVKDAMSDSEQLYRHVTGFTQKMLRKCGLDGE